MKQLLFLLLFPCLALAQYPSNGNQKITLGEQTTADGLVWRGRTTDTVNLMTSKLDTSAYLVLDTITEAIWLYRASTTPKWNRVVDSLNNLQGQLSLTTKVTGVLPVVNGGTGANMSSLPNNYLIRKNSSNIFDTAAIFEGGGKVGIGTATPNAKLSITNGNSFINFSEVVGALSYSGFNFSNTSAEITLSNYNMISNGASFFLNRPSGNDIAMREANASQMIIKTGGEVWIGYTADQGTYRLQVQDSVYVGGNVSASAYTTRSDYDLKDEIQNISYGINEVMQMQPVKYTYKSNGSTQLGFIAQDLGVITPEVVSFEDKMSVYYNALIPILTKAIQEQQAIIKALEKRILILENK